MTALRRRLAKLMCPSDANWHGNVHGGTILHLLEQTGRTVTTAYSKGPTALVGASQTAFKLPIHVGEVASVDAAVDYVGQHVMRVSMEVEAEDTMSGRKRRTNSAKMWYSTIAIESKSDTTTIAKAGSRSISPLDPSLVAPDAMVEYEASKSARAAIPLDDRIEEEFPIVLQELPGPDAIAIHPFVSAGYILKLMDSGAALAAISHARHQCVTVLLDKVCFSTPIQFGELVMVRAGVTFTSDRSVEVVCQIWKTPSGIDVLGDFPENISLKSVCAVEARFVFVAFDSNGKVISIPMLAEEKQQSSRWTVGAAKHKQRRRLSAK